MAPSALAHVLAHASWATLRLLEHCRSLDEAQRRLTTPGTYGTIEATLAHLVGAEQYYLSLLTGEAPSRWLDETERYAADELIPLARENAERLKGFARDDLDPSRVLPRRRGKTTAGVVLTQLVHHANEHRAQVCSVFGANGLEVPDLSSWHHGRELGVSD